MKNCIACNGQFKKIGEYQGFDIYKCNLCGLGKTKGEKQDYSDYHRDDTYINEDSQFRNIFQKRANIIFKFKKLGSILDIGSSTGTLLSIFKEKGWEVQGIEPSNKSSKEAAKKGIPTINSFFEKTKLDKKYDVVIANHVLEHVEDPVAFLKKAREVLNEDGIVLIDVPNFASMSAVRSGAKWQYLLPQEHLWHFTSKSLEGLFKKVGISVIYKETHSGIWEYGSPTLELLQSLLGLKKRFFLSFISAPPTWFISKFGLGTGLTIVGKK